MLLTDLKLPCDTCVHVLSLCLTQLVNKGASCGSMQVNFIVYGVSVIKLSHNAPKQNHMPNYAHIYLATIILKIMERKQPTQTVWQMV